MQCPRCKVEMKEGIALQEAYDERSVCRWFGLHIMNHETLEIIECLKCPSCGHSDDLH